MTDFTTYVLALICGMAGGVLFYLLIKRKDEIQKSRIVIVGGRGSGRTTELIKEASKYNYALIVCHNENAVRYTFQMARDMGANIPYPITFDDFIKRHYYGRSVQAFLFDNIDISLQSYTSVPIVKIAIEDR